jgi:hypothetical protein
MIKLGMIPQSAGIPEGWKESTALSVHIAKVLVSSTPLRAWQEHRLLGGGTEPKPTAAKERGTILHKLMLGGRTKIVVVNAPDFKTKAAQVKRDDARAAEKIPVLKEDFDELAAVAARFAPQLASVIGAPDDCELQCAWMSDYDVLCHGFVDSLRRSGPYGIEGIDDSRPLMTDLKFVGNAVEAADATKIAKLGYHIQRAAYLECGRVTDKTLEDCQFLLAFCETEAPFDLRFVVLDPSMRELGEEQWGRAVFDWRKCMKEKKWPGSGRRAHGVAAPGWMLKREKDLQNKLAKESIARVAAVAAAELDDEPAEDEDEDVGAAG